MELVKVAGLEDDGLMRLGGLVLHWFIHSLSVDWLSTEMIGANLCSGQSTPTGTKSMEFDDDYDWVQRWNEVVLPVYIFIRFARRLVDSRVLQSSSDL